MEAIWNNQAQTTKQALLGVKHIPTQKPKVHPKSENHTNTHKSLEKLHQMNEDLLDSDELPAFIWGESFF